jgi:diguanylate cyclase (GGDEF)-like protein
LCSDATERERVLDMQLRLRPLRTITFAVIALALTVSGPWMGWWMLAPLSAAGLAVLFADRGLERSRRPEFRLAAAWLVCELAITAAVALTGGPRSPMVAWLVLPVVTMASLVSVRAVAVGAIVAAVLLVTSTVGVDPSYVAAAPQDVAFPLALLGALALFSLAFMRSDLQHRTASVIDPLTSMLNRRALRARAGELHDQVAVVRQPIGLIVGDLDHFKDVNDTHGHAAGDALLRDVAAGMRRRLRAFDLAYRLGGEEFLVLLPGADEQQTARLAEELRRTIMAGDYGGVKITMSFGVSASEASSFDYDTVFEAADRALYQAKVDGRNCVCVARASKPGSACDPDGALPSLQLIPRDPAVTATPERGAQRARPSSPQLGNQGLKS